MNEAHFKEIEKVLLYISDARERAERGVKSLSGSGAEPHLIAALEDSQATLTELHRHLMRSTYFSVGDQDRLAV